MSDSPDAIRADIESTRRDLGGDVDALADKVTPSKIAQRQTRKVKSAFHSLTEKVMGSDDGGGHRSLGDMASDAGDAMGEAGQRVKAKAEGNPLAVGLIAFGVGWLVASLIPASEKEEQLAASAKDAAQPLVHEATDAAKQVASDLKEPAQNAAESVKNTAQDAAGTVKEEATDRANDVAGEARESAQRMQGDAQSH
jgi:gas vesicle protein